MSISLNSRSFVYAQEILPHLLCKSCEFPAYNAKFHGPCGSVQCIGCPTIEHHCVESNALWYPTSNNIFIENVLNKLQVFCLNKEFGCDKILARDNIIKHLDECSYSLCRSCNLTIKGATLSNHILYECQKRIIKCPYCSESGTADNIMIHSVDIKLCKGIDICKKFLEHPGIIDVLEEKFGVKRKIDLPNIPNKKHRSDDSHNIKKIGDNINNINIINKKISNNNNYNINDNNSNNYNINDNNNNNYNNNNNNINTNNNYDVKDNNNIDNNNCNNIDNNIHINNDNNNINNNNINNNNIRINNDDDNNCNNIDNNNIHIDNDTNNNYDIKDNNNNIDNNIDDNIHIDNDNDNDDNIDDIYSDSESDNQVSDSGSEYQESDQSISETEESESEESINELKLLPMKFIYKPHKSCPICKESVVSDIALREHLTHIHNNIMCFRCDKIFQFEQMNELNDHLKSHIGKFLSGHMCNYCGKINQVKDHHKKHLLVHEPNKKCVFCKKIYANTSSLNNHIKTIHKSNYNKKTIIVTDNLDTSITDEGNLKIVKYSSYHIRFFN